MEEQAVEKNLGPAQMKGGQRGAVELQRAQERLGAGSPGMRQIDRQAEIIVALFQQRGQMRLGLGQRGMGRDGLLYLRIEAQVAHERGDFAIKTPDDFLFPSGRAAEKNVVLVGAKAAGLDQFRRADFGIDFAANAGVAIPFKLRHVVGRSRRQRNKKGMLQRRHQVGQRLPPGIAQVVRFVQRQRLDPRLLKPLGQPGRRLLAQPGMQALIGRNREQPGRLQIARYPGRRLAGAQKQLDEALNPLVAHAEGRRQNQRRAAEAADHFQPQHRFSRSRRGHHVKAPVREMRIQIGQRARLVRTPRIGENAIRRKRERVFRRIGMGGRWLAERFGHGACIRGKMNGDKMRFEIRAQLSDGMAQAAKKTRRREQRQGGCQGSALPCPIAVSPPESPSSFRRRWPHRIGMRIPGRKPGYTSRTQVS
ncbi:MAG: hypothetical protein BWZ10_01796 [candidate division BRC1 bacterium ADurb.BinA364]|nr:MAG: hypothetical protein BWZ10_01796 [candidate division BRC1 bacterium ADurb.BinA364]